MSNAVRALAAVLAVLALPALAAAQARIPRLEVRLEEPGAYRAEVHVGEQSFSCAEPLREGAPCVLRDVPAGRARFVLDSTGDPHRVDTPVILRPSTRDVIVEEGITLDGALGYALIGLGITFAGPGTALIIAASCDPGDRLCEATPAVGATLLTIGTVLAFTGLYMITFGNPYELYGADARRDTRPAVSPEPEVQIQDPVGDPPVDPEVDQGETLPGQNPPAGPAPNETETAPETAPSGGPSGGLGLGPGGLRFAVVF